MGPMYRLNRKRRRAQGMTEYVIIVGLIGVLLVSVVSRFSKQLDVTIQGSADTTQNTVTDPIKQQADASQGNNSGGKQNFPSAGVAADGTALFQGPDGYYEYSGGQYNKSSKTPK